MFSRVFLASVLILTLFVGAGISLSEGDYGFTDHIFNNDTMLTIHNQTCYNATHLVEFSYTHIYDAGLQQWNDTVYNIKGYPCEYGCSNATGGCIAAPCTICTIADNAFLIVGYVFFISVLFVIIRVLNITQQPIKLLFLFFAMYLTDTMIMHVAVISNNTYLLNIAMVFQWIIFLLIAYFMLYFIKSMIDYARQAKRRE